MSEPEKLTPMMQQYFEARKGLAKDTLLLFRLGDFYEMFFDDAVLASRLLGLTLTKRQAHPMAGIPHHAAEGYVTKLLAAGKKVAFCEQAEPAQAGKLVRRGVTRILSPGTTLSASQLDAQRNHYLAALQLDSAGLHAAWLDLSTGEFKVATDAHLENLLPILTGLDPAELLIGEGELERWQAAPHERTGWHALHGFAGRRLATTLPGFHFARESGAQVVMATLGVLNLEGFGLAASHPALGPAGALIRYATENLCAKPENLRSLQEYRSGGAVLLDPATLRNLEVFSSSRGTKDGSLLAAVGRAQTAPGARLLERWLASPAFDRAEIERRQSLVGELLAEAPRLNPLREALSRVRDIPRILGRLQNRLRNPRELGGIRDTLMEWPALRELMGGARPPGAVAEHPGLAGLQARIQELPELRELLRRALADELPTDWGRGRRHPGRLRRRAGPIALADQ